MSPIIKSQKLKIVTSLLVIIFLISALLKIVNDDISFVLLTMYGCISTSVLTLKAGYFLFVILLQYFNADIILYYIKNIDYICIRYGDKKSVFNVLINKIIVLNILFVCLSLVGTELSLLVCKNDIQNFHNIDNMIIAIRGFGNCYLFSVIQVALLKYFDEAECFGIMSLIAMLITFINPFDIALVKGYKFIFRFSFWVFFYFVLSLLVTYILRKIFVKEHAHGNRSI